MKLKLKNEQIEELENELIKKEKNINNGVDIFTIKFDLVKLMNKIDITINNTKNNKEKIFI